MYDVLCSSIRDVAANAIPYRYNALFEYKYNRFHNTSIAVLRTRNIKHSLYLEHKDTLLKENYLEHNFKNHFIK